MLLWSPVLAAEIGQPGLFLGPLTVGRKFIVPMPTAAVIESDGLIYGKRAIHSPAASRISGIAACALATVNSTSMLLASLARRRLRLAAVLAIESPIKLLIGAAGMRLSIFVNLAKHGTMPQGKVL
jgi:hypothetical protein